MLQSGDARRLHDDFSLPGPCALLWPSIRWVLAGESAGDGASERDRREHIEAKQLVPSQFCVSASIWVSVCDCRVRSQSKSFVRLAAAVL